MPIGVDFLLVIVGAVEEMQNTNIFSETLLVIQFKRTIDN